MAKLGDVVFSLVENEKPEYSNDVTDRPTEKETLVDNIKHQPLKLNINGIVTGEDAAEKIRKLREYAKSEEFFRYVGRNVFNNMAIEFFTTDHNARISNGFAFSMILKQVKISRSQTVEITLPDPVTNKPTKTQTKKTTNKGIQQARRTTSGAQFRQALVAQGLASEVFG